MADQTTIAVSRSCLFERGDYIDIGGWTHRAVGTDEYTVTTRPLHRWRWVEWMRAHWEDRVAWPIRDRLNRWRNHA